MVRDLQIEAILTRPTSLPSQLANTLVQAALSGGGVGNMSAILVRAGEEDDGMILFSSPREPGTSVRLYSAEATGSLFIAL